MQTEKQNSNFVFNKQREINSIREDKFRKTNIKENSCEADFCFWEYVHLRDLTIIKKIFLAKIKELDIYIDVNDNSFTYMFNDFLYQCSSKKISKYKENDLSQIMENKYFEYTIKRHIS